MIKLPECKEELYARLKAKARYNIKREKKLLETEAGVLVFEEYNSGNIPSNVIEAYFAMKKQPIILITVLRLMSIRQIFMLLMSM